VRAIAARVFHSEHSLRPRRATRGSVRDPRGRTIDEGLALLFAAPHSYTGEDVLELHLHGSPALVRETLLAVFAAGARQAEAGEFTRRAFLAGKLDLSAAEAVAETIAAEHRAGVRAAAAELSGGLAREVDGLRAQLEALAAELAASLDFPDEVATPPHADVRARLAAVHARLRELAGDYERGRLVREGAAVAIVGPPNAGKSSLFNALLGNERALVSEVPGTTRDSIEESLALDALLLRAIDTAGLRDGADALEAAGIARSEATLHAARVALVVVDGSLPLGAHARAVLERTRDRARVVFFNKSDLGRAGYDAREPAERDALSGSTRDEASLAAVRQALAAVLGADDEPDLSRPHLVTARQAGTVLEAERALGFALATLDAGEPLDLIAGDLTGAIRALGELTGREADEALLDAVFARFCVGK
jgi:tRNA modification GTPase